MRFYAIKLPKFLSSIVVGVIKLFKREKTKEKSHGDMRS